MHSYLAKTRVEQAEMNSLVGAGDLNLKKKKKRTFSIKDIFCVQGPQI